MSNTLTEKIVKPTAMELVTSQSETLTTRVETLLDAELTTPLLPLSLLTLPFTAHTLVLLETTFAEPGVKFTANLFKTTVWEPTPNTKTLLHA